MPGTDPQRNRVKGRNGAGPPPVAYARGLRLLKNFATRAGASGASPSFFDQLERMSLAQGHERLETPNSYYMIS